jgi:hypothetical protein
MLRPAPRLGVGWGFFVLRIGSLFVLRIEAVGGNSFSRPLPGT